MTDPAPPPTPPLAPGKAWLLLAWRRKWWLVFAAAVGLAGGATVYVQKPRVYESSTQVLVDRRPLPPSISQQSEAQHEQDDLETHVTLILSPEIADRAAKLLAALPGPDVLAAAAAAGGPAAATHRRPDPGPYAVPPAAILVGLTVTRDNNGVGRVLTIAYRSHSADEDPRVLNAVVQGYQEFLAEKSSGGTAETLDILTRAMDVLDGELSVKKSEYDTFRKEHPLVWGKDAAGPRVERYKIIQEKLTAFLSRQIEIEDRLQQAQRELRAGTRRAAVADAIARAERTKVGEITDPTRQTREEQVLALRVEEQQLTDAGFGPNFDELRNVRRKIEMLEKNPFQSDADRAVSIPAGGDALDGWLARLRQEFDENKGRQGKWDAQMKVLNAEQKEQLALENAHETFQKDIDNRQQYFNLLLKQLSERKLLGGGGGLTARVIAPAGPGRKVAPSLPQSLALGLAMGLAAGAGLAFLSDLLDQSFRNPADVRNRLGLPLLGHLPPLRPRAVAGSPVAPAVVAYHSPGSAEAEAVRRIRAALKLRTAGPGPKVLQVTSPDAGAGKSVVAANLAVSLAQTGKKVLLVEADHRRPGMDVLFGVEAGAGFAAALAGAAGPDESVRPTSVPNLAVVPWGDDAGDPADLLTSPRFEQLLAAWGGTYSLILIDSPPTLAVHDAGEVAHRANGVLLVVPATAAARPAAGRAVATLRAAGANLVGVVVNLGAKGAKAGGYELDRFDRGMPVGPPTSRAVTGPGIRPEDVRDGLLNGEFFLEYLPTVRLEDGKCVGVEALARWRRPGGVVPPSEFIPRIRNTPVAALLTRWVVETVATELGPWLRGAAGVHLSVNVPLDVLGQREIEAVGRRAGLADLAGKFVFEVTERGTPGRLAADAREAVAARPGDARIALDDVGLDGVDLLSLTRLGVDIVKLDKSVADLLAAEGAAGGVMRQLAGAVRAAAFQVVAEGVETAAQADLLRAAGVTLAQGWLFSKPLQAGKFLEYYAARPGGGEDEPIVLTVRPPGSECEVKLADPVRDSDVVDFDAEPVPLTTVTKKPRQPT